MKNKKLNKDLMHLVDFYPMSNLSKLYQQTRFCEDSLISIQHQLPQNIDFPTNFEIDVR